MKPVAVPPRFEAKPESLRQRFGKVWYWFLPIWLWPVYFLTLRLIASVIRIEFALVGLFAWGGLGSLIATNAKRSLSWGEFYLFSALITFALACLGMAGVLVCAGVSHP